MASIQFRSVGLPLTWTNCVIATPRWEKERNGSFT